AVGEGHVEPDSDLLGDELASGGAEEVGGGGGDLVGAEQGQGGAGAGGSGLTGEHGYGPGGHGHPGQGGPGGEAVAGGGGSGFCGGLGGAGGEQGGGQCEKRSALGRTGSEHGDLLRGSGRRPRTDAGRQEIGMQSRNRTADSRARDSDP